ncbi:MAG TPA: hypothetical protein PLJ21_01375 [Pseudobdellovibrionaceae bacterium]|nr:hypothetical protein [Pseudobdellovibrionaceae bacterium]
MKPTFLAILLLQSVAFAGNQIQVSLSDVVKRVSENNYNVYENALKVYQAKINIEKARADMLPKLNIWGIAKIIIDPISVIDQVSDVAPFLVPTNWFRLEQVKLLYLAEKEGYRALWGNELNSAKSLYVHLLFDQNLLAHVQNSIEELQKIYRIALTRENFGGARPGTARDIEIKMLGLKEDEQNLITLLSIEHDQLSYALGYTSNIELFLDPVILPNLENATPIYVNDYEFRVLSSSPERRQFDHFLSALSQVKKEIEYSFLGSSNISRGVAGGIFDGLPSGTGLGFGNGSALKIIDAQRQLMQTQKLGIEEVLKRQLRAVAIQYNSDVTSFSNFKRRVELSRDARNSLLRRIQLGENIDVLELSDVSRNQIQAEAALLSVGYRTLNSLDRLNRLIFDGDYTLNPPLIDSLKGNKP